jgi:eukaryotic-like serine/threonine-protein kinase
MQPPPKRLNKYEIVERVGHGGMGVLYRAHDPDLDRIVAVKVLRADFSAPDAEERFTREARALARLKHPNIVRVFDFGRADDQWFLVMEFIVGQTLAELIADRAPTTLASRLGVFDQMCAAVAYAHDQGWIHRDLKPSNVMLDREDHLVKVLDFGLARQLDAGLTQHPGVMGSPNYMAPEQALGRSLDRRADVFSVSSVLYELLTYQKAFPGETPQDAMLAVISREPPAPSCIDATIPPALDAIVCRGLAKAPDDRFPDLHAYRHALRSHVQAIPVQHGNPEKTGSTPQSQVTAAVTEAVRHDSAAENPRQRRAVARVVFAAASASCVAAALAGGLAWHRAVSRVERPSPAAESVAAAAATDNVQDSPDLPAPKPVADHKQDARSPVAGQPTPGHVVPVERRELPIPATPQASGPRIDDGDAVTQTLARYASAYNSLDARAVAALMVDVEVDALEQSFSRYASFHLAIEPTTTTIESDVASVVCRETRQFKNATGEIVTLPAETVTYELRRRGEGWVIVRAVH